MNFIELLVSGFAIDYLRAFTSTETQKPARSIVRSMLATPFGGATTTQFRPEKEKTNGKLDFPLNEERTSMKASFGWTVIRSSVRACGFLVYRRDCPADAEHFAADLAPFTFQTKKQAEEAGRQGYYYAYKPAT